MPKNNDIIRINFSYEDIDTINCQEAPKFLLRSMYELSKNGGSFKYIELLNFMKSNYNNELYYKGHGIRSLKNIDYYWRYAKSDFHNARIPNFKNLVIL